MEEGEGGEGAYGLPEWAHRHTMALLDGIRTTTKKKRGLYGDIRFLALWHPVTENRESGIRNQIDVDFQHT